MRLAPLKNRPSSRLLVLAVLLVAVLIAMSWRMRGTSSAPASSGGTREADLVRADRVTPPPASLKNDPATRAPEPWREAPTRTGLDASNLYKNAFVLFDRLTEAEKKMIRQPREEVEAEQAAALFEKIRPILELLRAAAKADYCDWGMAPYTFDTPLPHISKAMDLGKLGLWAVAYEFPSDPATALSDLGARAQLGHHMADTIIGLLIETSFEKGAHDLLRQNQGSFDAATSAAAAEFIRASSLEGDLGRAFATEAASMEATMKQLAAKSVEERAQMLGALATPDADPAARATADEILAMSGDPARLAAEVAFLRQTEEAMGDAMKLPEAQFQSWWKGVESELGKGHPLAKLALPAIAGVQRRVQQARVERTLLSAGLDIQQSGPAQLARYRDPATGQSLIYLPTPSGFELRSTYQVKGKPVTMSFSSPR